MRHYVLLHSVKIIFLEKTYIVLHFGQVLDNFINKLNNQADGLQTRLYSSSIGNQNSKYVYAYWRDHIDQHFFMYNLFLIITFMHKVNKYRWLVYLDKIKCYVDHLNSASNGCIEEQMGKSLSVLLWNQYWNTIQSQCYYNVHYIVHQY